MPHWFAWEWTNIPNTFLKWGVAAIELPNLNDKNIHTFNFPMSQIENWIQLTWICTQIGCFVKSWVVFCGHNLGYSRLQTDPLSTHVEFRRINIDTLWLFNIAMENGPFIGVFPIKTSIYKGFSMAMLNNQMVYTLLRMHVWFTDTCTYSRTDSYVHISIHFIYSRIYSYVYAYIKSDIFSNPSTYLHRIQEYNLSIYRSIDLSIYLSVCLSIYLSISPSLSLSLSTYLSIYLSPSRRICTHPFIGHIAFGSRACATWIQWRVWSSSVNHLKIWTQLRKNSNQENIPSQLWFCCFYSSSARLLHADTQCWTGRKLSKFDLAAGACRASWGWFGLLRPERRNSRPSGMGT